MCGIAGIININNTEKVRHPLSILTMRDCLAHRGPDAKADYISEDGKVILGHRRLSLVGLDKKATIMSIPKKDKAEFQVSIVFNGEIYNYKELKKYFLGKGYTSVSPSDFEAIIFAWQEWGENCVDHLIGEFVFVVYDEETKEIFIARDRTGVKPLFYALTEYGEFVFASEPKSLLQYPDVKNDPDVSSIAEFLLMSHTFAAGSQNERSSFYAGIKQFPPAHCAKIIDGDIAFRRYYQLPFADSEKRKKKENIEKVRTTLTKAVSDRIPEEVATGIGLSGGLDSSIIAALVKRDSKAKDILASCIRYTGDTNEDYIHAKILADKDDIRLVSPNVSPEEMVATIDQCIINNDGPVDSIRRMGMFLNYKKLKDEGYRTALIGEGADEMNLGYYHKFPGLKLDREFCDTPENLKRLFEKRASYVKQFFTRDFLEKVDFEKIIDDIIEENYTSCTSTDPVKRMQYFYAKRFLLYLQDGNDRAAMANSVEARLPFVDPDVVDVCLAVPQEQNITKTSEKMVLREAFRDILPIEITERKKSPFPANEDMKLHKLLADTFKTEMDSASDAVWAILDKDFVVKLEDSFRNKIRDLEETYGENKGGQFLTAWLPISGEVELRTNQIFSVLTMIRWMNKIYGNF